MAVEKIKFYWHLEYFVLEQALLELWSVFTWWVQTSRESAKSLWHLINWRAANKRIGEVVRESFLDTSVAFFVCNRFSPRTGAVQYIQGSSARPAIPAARSFVSRKDETRSNRARSWRWEARGPGNHSKSIWSITNVSRHASVGLVTNFVFAAKAENISRNEILELVALPLHLRSLSLVNRLSWVLIAPLFLLARVAFRRSFSQELSHNQWLTNRGLELLSSVLCFQWSSKTSWVHERCIIEPDISLARQAGREKFNCKRVSMEAQGNE